MYKLIISCFAFTALFLGNSLFAECISEREMFFYEKTAILEPVLEQNVFTFLNQQRVERGLTALIWSPTVATQARNHSVAMADNVLPFGHDGVDIRFQNINKVIPSTNFGENVAYNQGDAFPALTACQAWLKSPGHYANIVGDFNMTGIGVAKSSDGKYYFTQIFIKAIYPYPVKVDLLEESLEEVFEGNNV